MGTFLRCIGVTAMAVAVSGYAHGQEIRLGVAVGGMDLVYGVLPQVDTFHLDNLDAVQFDLFIDAPDALAFRWIGSPRLMVGGLANFRGRESSLHAGMNWHLPLFDTPLFAEVGLGLGVHNGVADGAVAPMRNLGCSFGIHYSYGIGAQLTDSFSIMGTFQHLSHAYLCSGPNEGLNNFGLTAGYKF